MPTTDDSLTPIENDVLKACRDNDCHGAHWFPRVFRETMNFPEGPSDEEIQQALLRLIDTQWIEVGTWNGDTFVAQAVTPEVLRDLRRNPGTDLFTRTRPTA
jgi:hypothetical protein